DSHGRVRIAVVDRVHSCAAVDRVGVGARDEDLGGRRAGQVVPAGPIGRPRQGDREGRPTGVVAVAVGDHRGELERGAADDGRAADARYQYGFVGIASLVTGTDVLDIDLTKGEERILRISGPGRRADGEGRAVGLRDRLGAADGVRVIPDRDLEAFEGRIV